MAPAPRTRPIHHVVVTLTIALALAGCGTALPVAKFTALETATRQVQQGTHDTYARIATLQDAESAARAATEDQLTPSSFTSPSTDIVPALRVREAALDVLVSYTQALRALASRDPQSEVDSATLDLAGSLKSLAATVGPQNTTATQAMGVMATVVDIIGRAIVRREQLDTLRRAMDTGQPGVDALAKLLSTEDAGDIAARVGNMQSLILTTANVARRSAPLAARMVVDREASVTVASAHEIQAELDALSKAVAVIPRAHAEIRQALDARESPRAALESLVAEAKRINRFYRSAR